MRATQLIQRTLRGALPLVLAQSLVANALAWDLPRPRDDRDGPRKEWVCEYMRGPDSIPYMFCDDLVSLMDGDVALEDDRRAGTAKYFPLWGTPSSDAKAVELAQILLCNQSDRCNVRLANGLGGTRVALH